MNCLPLHFLLINVDQFAFQAFPVNCEVDSLLLNRIYLGASKKFGGSFMAGLIGEPSIEFYDERRCPKKLNFNTGRPLSELALVHCVQDVRLPLAGIAIIVDRYCQAHRMLDSTNVLPIIHHILMR